MPNACGHASFRGRQRVRSNLNWHRHMPLAQQDPELADRHIGAGLERIRLQRNLIERLHCDGHDTTSFTEILRLFETTLNLMVAHRELIARELEHRSLRSSRD